MTDIFESKEDIKVKFAEVNKENNMINILVNNINRLCDDNNVSINQMLKDCGLSKSLIDNLKKGSVPSVDKIAKVADYFNVSTDYLLGNEQKEKSPSASDEDLKVYEMYSKLNSEDKELIIKMMDKMIK